MSITDELRKWWVTRFPVMDKQLHHSFTAIADRIDERVAELLREQDATLRAEFDAMNDGWVRLPKDADGEYIHIGDMLIDKDDKILKPSIVKCVLYNDEGCAVSDIDPHGCWYEPSFLRHYHAPTVEDLLRDMHAKLDEVTALYVGEAIDSDERDSDEARIFAEYAAKLRLAGDAE